MPRRPTSSPRALQRGRIRTNGGTVSPACCGSSRSCWVNYARNVVGTLYVPPATNSGLPLTPTRQGSVLGLTLHCLGPFLVASNPARERGAERYGAPVGLEGRAISSIETRSSRGWPCTCPLGIAEICRLVSLRCSRARMPESHDRPATWVPGTRPARLDHPAPPSRA